MLARQEMQLDSDPLDAAIDDHLYFSKEASSGGRSFAGGGRDATEAEGPLPPGAGARRRLMAASCALLSAGAARSQQPAPAPVDSGLLEDWSVDSALAYYHEQGRIQAVEPVVDVAKVFADGQALNLQT